MTARATGDVLTIAIPTFDRNEVLARTVAALLPQLQPGVRLVIRDNASPRPVRDTLGPLLAGRSDVTLLTNPVNIGGNANVLRCLESCGTEWIWVLGDDDTPMPDAVQRILADIAAAPAPRVAISYRCELHARRQPLELTGADDFVARVDSLSSVLFLSTNVLRARALQPHLRLAYAYAYCNMPQIIALMQALGETGQMRLAMEQIVSWGDAGAPASWSVVNAALAFPTLLDLPIPQHRRLALARTIEADVHPELLGLARQLLALACAQGDGAAARWTWRQICHRRFGGLGVSRRRLLAWLLGGLFLAPRLTRPCVEWVARVVLGEGAGRNALQDRTRRI